MCGTCVSVRQSVSSRVTDNTYRIMRLAVLPIIFIFGVSLHQVGSLNILGVFPYEGKSHFFVFEPLLRELASRGHNLTVISHFPQKKPIDNYNDISLAGKSQVLEGVFPIENSYWSMIKISSFLITYGAENCKLLLRDENVQELWKTGAQFDVVLTEQFQSDCSLGLAHKLGAPVVGLTSHFLMPWHYQRFGIKYNPSYMPFMFFGGGTRPTFFQKIERTIFEMYLRLLYKYFEQRVDERTLAQYIGEVPPLEELAQDMQMLLLYQYPALSDLDHLPANVKQVGGFHVAKPKELPEDLKKFVEESEHGVIYISFGSMLKANSTPRDKLEAIIGAISELPQRVIWKWEEKQLPGNPKNIYLSKWTPQNDILAHPKVLAFYSHCGLLGTTEAMHYGVPMVGMPVFGDQPGNAAMVEESGLGVQIQITDLTKELLLEKLRTVLDPKFRAQVKKVSAAWHDRPTSAMDSAIFWTEFAARHSEMSFKSAAVDVPLYQYLGLDVLGTFLLILTILVVFVNSFCSRRSNRNQNKKQD